MLCDEQLGHMSHVSQSGSYRLKVTLYAYPQSAQVTVSNRILWVSFEPPEYMLYTITS
jgi:hypothetical protein